MEGSSFSQYLPRTLAFKVRVRAGRGKPNVRHGKEKRSGVGRVSEDVGRVG